jgi:type VI secretion system secreted protein VgrG
VVGPQSEEIYCDEYGRVKVQFNWDRQGKFDEHASGWIRVSQGMAGGAYGMLFLPRVGQEVIVDFLEGDPDRPIITGRVYNKDHMPPYKLPDDKTISAIRTCSSRGAGGANEIRFNDAKGKEQLLLFAQNSLHLRAGGSRFEAVGGEAHEIIAGDVYELAKKSKCEVVNLDLFKTVKGDIEQFVKGRFLEDVLGERVMTVHGTLNFSSEEGEIFLDAAKGVTLSCGGNFIKIDSSGITILGNKVDINSGGSMGIRSRFNAVETTLPLDADSTRFGHNVRYTQSSSDNHEEPAGPEKKTSWIEIELVDDLGQPCAGEAFKLVDPEGHEQSGNLNEKGQAHVGLRKPGTCQISFPNLDAAAWERI